MLLSWFFALLLWLNSVNHISFVVIEQQSFREPFCTRQHTSAALSLSFICLLFKASGHKHPGTTSLGNIGICMIHTDLTLAMSWVKAFKFILLLQLFHWLESNYAVITVFCVLKCQAPDCNVLCRHKITMPAVTDTHWTPQFYKQT